MYRREESLATAANVSFVKIASRCVTACALALAVLAPAAKASPTPVPTYVALGDSYTSAPLISRPVGQWGSKDNPYGCGKSDQNYPHLLAQHLGVFDPANVELPQYAYHPGFIDISCGSAETENMTAPQPGLPDGATNPPQFDAFKMAAAMNGHVTLVSLGIGGNDVGFGELTDYCVQPPEALGGTPCRVHYENRDGATDPSIQGDIIQHRLGLLRPRLDALIAQIHQLAPDAEVLVYGYPDLLPEYTDGCYPYIPVLPTDAAYLRGVEKDLNHTIRAAAAANGAHYVDWYSPSITHDACAPPGQAWVNGAVLVPPSYPVHPNLLGTRAGANAGIGVLDAIDFHFATGRPWVATAPTTTP